MAVRVGFRVESPAGIADRDRECFVLQRERPERLRSTLAVFFVAGSALGLGGLAVGGQLESRQVLAGSAWVAFALAGQALAGPLRRRVDPTRFRRLVLGFCVVASLAVIVRAVLA